MPAGESASQSKTNKKKSWIRDSRYVFATIYIPYTWSMAQLHLSGEDCHNDTYAQIISWRYQRRGIKWHQELLAQYWMREIFSTLMCFQFARYSLKRSLYVLLWNLGNLLRWQLSANAGRPNDIYERWRAYNARTACFLFMNQWVLRITLPNLATGLSAAGCPLVQCGEVFQTPNYFLVNQKECQ